MERILPIIVIDEVEFYVDATKEVIWQAGKPQNRISFDVFYCCSKGYRFLYNKKNCSHAKNKAAVNRHLKSYAWVTVTALMELDPVGIALRYGIPLEALCSSTKARLPKKIMAKLSPVQHLK